MVQDILWSNRFKFVLQPDQRVESRSYRACLRELVAPERNFFFYILVSLVSTNALPKTLLVVDLILFIYVITAQLYTLYPSLAAETTYAIGKGSDGWDTSLLLVVAALLITPQGYGQVEGTLIRPFIAAAHTKFEGRSLGYLITFVYTTGHRQSLFGPRIYLFFFTYPLEFHK